MTGHCSTCGETGGCECNLSPSSDAIRVPTHRCKVCGALWINWQDGTWSLASQECGQCCNNVAMGDQIEELRAVPDRPTEADFQWAANETTKLQSDLDITNADHIVLWLEENARDFGDGLPLAWLACRIIEAHEAAIAPVSAIKDEMIGHVENPPAFPRAMSKALAGPDATERGMTLRDWFAGQALAGLMANANMPFAPDYAECEPKQIAEASFDIADAMLVARTQKPPHAS